MEVLLLDVYAKNNKCSCCRKLATENDELTGEKNYYHVKTTLDSLIAQMSICC